MPDTVLIEVATALPEWMFSWWHFAILAGLILFVILTAVFRFDTKRNSAGSIAVSIIGLSILAIFAWGFLSAFLYGGEKVVPEPEAERVATEISEVTGVPVTAEQVQGMQDGDYVPGVNYDRLTDSDGGLVFKVEVK